MILHDGITLYHGSYCPVQKIDMAFCASGKDFGKGFYLTTDLNQAKNDTSKNCMGATIQRRYLAQFFWDLDICANSPYIGKRRVLNDFTTGTANQLAV